MDEESPSRAQKRQLIELADACSLSGKWISLDSTDGQIYWTPDEFRALIDSGESMSAPSSYHEIIPEIEIEKAGQALMAANRHLSMLLSKLTGRTIIGGSDTPRV